MKRLNPLLLLALLFFVAVPAFAGVSWQQSGGPEGGIINALVIDPTSAQTVYAATDNGVYKTTNGGTSWTQRSTGLTNMRVTSLAVRHLSTQTLYAGTDGGGVFRSVDGGGTWSAINSGLTALDVTCLGVSRSSTGVIYAGTSGKLFKSTNGGDTWTEVGSGQFFSINTLAVDPTNPDIVYVGTGTVYKTTDGGSTWRDIGSSHMAANVHEVNALAIDPTSPGTVYAATFPGFYKSTDFGATWTYWSIFHTLSIAIAPSSPGTLYVGHLAMPHEPGYDNGVLKSVNGAYFTDLRNGLTSNYIGCLAVDPTTPDIVYAGTGNGVLKSTDGGSSWSEVNSGLTNSRITSLIINPVTPQKLYVATENPGTERSRVFKSSTGGASWSLANTGLPADRDVRAMAMDDQYLYAGTFFKGVYVSYDDGYSWEQGGLNDLSILSFATYGTYPDSYVFAGSSEGVQINRVDYLSRFKTSWSDFFYQFAKAIIYSPQRSFVVTNTRELYVRIGYSYNWAPVTIDPQTRVSVESLAVDPANPDIIYAGTSLNGIYKTTDGGTSWSRINNGLGSSFSWDMSITSLVIDPFTPEIIYAGTDGNGVFKSTDGGTSWSRVNDGLGNVHVTSLAIDPVTPQVLYAGTEGGVFRGWSLSPPTVTTGNPSDVTRTGATLNGTVAANGAATTVTIEYGPTTSYGTTVSALQSPLASTARTVAVTAGITGLTCNSSYHYRVTGANSEGTTAGSDVAFTTGPCPPAVVTGSASAIIDKGGVLNGVVTANGALTTVTFQYGGTTAYGTTVTATQSPVLSGGTSTAVSAPIADLACSTTYHFRVVGQNSAGVVNGADATFSTAVCAPTVATGAATQISRTGVTLNGTVSANGGATTVTYRYGLTTAYGSTVTAPQSPVAANATALSVPATVSGLLCGTTYHYQMAGQNSTGTTIGSDATFTTTACAEIIGYPLWTRQRGTTGDDSARSVARDGSGNAYVTSTTNLYDANTGQYVYTESLKKYNSSGALLWNRDVVTSTSPSYGYGGPANLAVDFNGNSYVSGETSVLYAGVMTSIPFLKRYDSSGTLLWTIQPLSRGPIATDSGSNAYVVGFRYDPNAMGPPSSSLSKYNSGGTPVWTQQVGTAGAIGSGFPPDKVATDSGNNVYVIGASGYDAVTGAFTPTAYLKKYNSSGTLLWTRQLETSGSVSYGQEAMAVEPGGSTYVAKNVDKSTGDGFSQYIVVTKYDTNGTSVWERQVNTQNYETAASITTDSGGNVYVTGPWYASDSLIFLKFDSNGTLLSHRRHPTSETWGISVVSTMADSGGNVFVAGNVSGSFTGQTSAGGQDIFLMKVAFATGSGGGSDQTAPFINQFSIPASFDGLSVPVTILATDNTGNAGITGYCLTQESLPGNCLWTTDLPSYYIFPAYGATTLYLFVKDASGNVAAAFAATTLSPPGGAAPSWTLNSAGPGGAQIDWLTSSFGILNPGSYVRINSTVYHVQASANASWSGSLYNYATLVSCDQKTGVVTEGIPVDLTGVAAGTPLSWYPVWSDVLNDNTFGSSILWTRQSGTAGEEYAGAVARDGSGNAYVTVSSSGYDPATGQQTTTVSLMKYDTSGTLLWTTPATTSTGAMYGGPAGLAVDSGGSAYVAGTTSVYDATTALTTTTPFLSRYSTSGTLLWKIQPASEMPDSLATDAAGNTFLLGYHFEPGMMQPLLQLMKYGTSGTLLWTQQVGSMASPTRIGTDSWGNAYVMTTTDVYDSATGLNTRTGTLKKYAGNNGTLLWTKQLEASITPTTFMYSPEAMTVDVSGNVYRATTVEISASDGFLQYIKLSRYDTNGNHVWDRLYNTGNYESVSAMATDPTGNVYVGGISTQSQQDILFLKYDSNGALLATERYALHGAYSTTVGSTVADAAGNLYVAGSLYGTLSGYPSAGGRDMFLMKVSFPGTSSGGGWSDLTAPFINKFSLPASFDGLNVPITILATDSTGITGYCLTQESLPGNCVWTAYPPAYYVFPAYGAATLYLFVKDASGNIATAFAATTLYPPGGAAPAWTLNSAGSGGAQIDWLASSFGILNPGTYVRINNTLFYVQSSANGSWSGSLYNYAALKNCDQKTGVVVEGVPVDLTGIAAGTPLAWYPAWSDVMNGNTFGSSIMWTRQAGTAGDECVGSVVRDGLGNAYVTVASNSNDPVTMQLRSTKSLMKYDGSGTLLWTTEAATSTGLPAYCSPGDVAVDPGGNVYFAGTVGVYDATTAVTTRTSFLSKYSSSGTLIWKIQPASEISDNLVTDAAGNVRLLGYHFEGGPGQPLLQLMNYNTSGTLLWTQQVGAAVPFLERIGTDSAGNAYVRGASDVYDAATGLTTRTTFLKKLAGSGTLLWSKQLGVSTRSNTYMYNIEPMTVDASGNVYLAETVENGTADGFDQYIKLDKFDTNGNHVWERQYNTDDYESVTAMAIDLTGNVYMAGSLSPSQTEILFVKYDSNGILLATGRYQTCGASATFVSSTVADAAGNLYVAGTLFGSLSGYPSAGGRDMFLMKVSFPGTGGGGGWSDQSAPFISQFSMPASFGGLDVPVTILATDNAGVTGYCLTQEASPTNCAWTMATPSSYTFSAYGAATLHLYVKDAAGNISTAVAATECLSQLATWTLRVTLAGVGSGTVFSDVPGLSCSGGICTGTFPQGTTVNLVANPSFGSGFGGWGLGCTGTGTCSLTSATSVTASFANVLMIKLDNSLANHLTLQNAYDAAVEGESLLMQVYAFMENLSFNRNIKVKLKGGKDAGYNSTIGVTTIKGSLNISQGSVELCDIVIQP